MLEALGKRAKDASRILMTASTTQKNAALSAIAAAFAKNKDYILAENEKDLAAAKESGMPKAMLDRLALNDVRVQGLSDAASDVMALEDPIGKIRSILASATSCENAASSLAKNEKATMKSLEKLLQKYEDIK